MKEVNPITNRAKHIGMMTLRISGVPPTIPIIIKIVKAANIL
jgi:hypothetical protein